MSRSAMNIITKLWFLHLIGKSVLPRGHHGVENRASFKIKLSGTWFFIFFWMSFFLFCLHVEQRPADLIPAPMLES